jgi:hypothetical protein
MIFFDTLESVLASDEADEVTLAENNGWGRSENELKAIKCPSQLKKMSI